MLTHDLVSSGQESQKWHGSEAQSQVEDGLLLPAAEAFQQSHAVTS